jgi:hypothetical protein
MITKLSLVRDTEFKKLADNVKPDAKNRVNLHGIKVPQGVIYHIYCNRSGQIVLDPQVAVPASEVWLFQNPEALASIRRGLNEAKKGKTTKIGLKDL